MNLPRIPRGVIAAAAVLLTGLGLTRTAAAARGPVGGGGALGTPPPPVPGYYGPRWGNRRPASLPANAPGATAAGAARAYGLALARRWNADPLWLAAIDHMGAKESGWSAGRPADRFDEANRSAWGVFQYFSSSAADEVTFRQYRGQRVWFMPWEIQWSAPIERFHIRWGEAVAASPTRSPVAGVAGIFLHQAKPAWRHRFWELLRAGAEPRAAVQQTCDEKGDSAAGGSIVRHVNAVIRLHNSGAVA